MSKSSSILTALPKVKMYCMTEANSHMFRILWRSEGSCFFCSGSEASISSLVRFRGMMKGICAKRECTKGEKGVYEGMVGSRVMDESLEREVCAVREVVVDENS